MAMKSQWACDRCKALIAIDEYPDFVIFHQLGKQDDRRDLCPACSMSFSRWFERPDPMPGNPQT